MSLFPSQVYAILPRTGMCNRLFVWANAFVFSELNDLPLFTHGWQKMQLGPWLRKEKRKRIYLNYFIARKNHTGLFFRKLISKAGICIEPPVDHIKKEKNNYTYIFNCLPHSGDYFSALKKYRQRIISGLYDSISREVKDTLQDVTAPQIGVHVRRGDFKKAGLGENLDYFIRAINFLREKHGEELKVTIFSDGNQEELNDILKLPMTELNKGGSDIEDLLALSKSDFIVTSHHSTFSYWAAFLSDAMILHTEEYTGTPIRETRFINEGHFIIEQKSPAMVEVKNLYRQL